MKQFKPETGPIKNEVGKEKEKEGKYRTSKMYIASWFKSCKTTEDVVESIKSALSEMSIPSKKMMEDSISALENCKNIENRNDFVEAAFSALKPLIDLKIERPDLFKQEKDEKNEKNFIHINDLLSYGVDENLIHIHVIPEDRIENAMTKFSEGLKELAKVVEENPKIKLLKATSWIIGMYPKIIERFGFILDGEIDEELREKHFKGDRRKIGMAHMEREEFLKRYLK